MDKGLYQEAVCLSFATGKLLRGCKGLERNVCRFCQETAYGHIDDGNGLLNIGSLF